ncbi:MAG: rhomboid family intramembrane serine protease [Acidimicrobiia bacterium]|nr:rhomboid family intramembrane serine protease [bacterium]MYB25325.1 rhomboid family intramembrane serine protease [Acidimicrobiia bacterium]
MSARAASEAVCYRHADRAAGVNCQRCERPICPDCQIIAPVGFHCPTCLAAARRARPAVAAGSRMAAPARRRVRPVVVSGPAAFDLAKRPAVLTGSLIAANLVLFVMSAATRRSAWRGLGDITERGALWGPAVDVGGEWWRLFTSGFLHANILHVGFNVLLLGLLGASLERQLGVARYVLLYLAALLSGSMGALLVSPRALTIGASGAVFGLMGAHLMVSRALGRRARDSGVMGLLVLNLVTTFLFPNISIGGHIGGLAGGLLASWILLAPDRGGRVPRWLASMAGLGLAGLFFFTGLVTATTWIDPIF